MPVDSFKYVPRLIKRYYQATQVKKELPVPFTRLKKTLAESKFSLVTTGGLYHRGHEEPFDLQGESERPSWGDPTYRTLPSKIPQAEVCASHHHININGVLADINVLLPVDRFRELEQEKRIGGLADDVYSFMGYQGFPSDLKPWRELYGPQVTQMLLAEEVDCVLLTSA